MPKDNSIKSVLLIGSGPSVLSDVLTEGLGSDLAVELRRELPVLGIVVPYRLLLHGESWVVAGAEWRLHPRRQGAQRTVSHPHAS